MSDRDSTTSDDLHAYELSAAAVRDMSGPAVQLPGHLGATPSVVGPGQAFVVTSDHVDELEASALFKRSTRKPADPDPGDGDTDDDPASAVDDTTEENDR